MEHSDDDFITSYLFPNEAVTYRPDAEDVVRERQRIEENVWERKCSRCGKQFANKCNLNRHLKRVRCKPSPAKDLSCGTCRNSFGTQFNLRRHINRGCNKAHTCDIYETTFSAKRILKSHVRLKHALNCPICAKAMVSKEDLKRQDFRMIKEIRKLRKIADRSVLAQKRPNPSQSQGPVVDQASPQPGPSGVQRVTPPVFEQTSRRLHGDTGIVYKIIPDGLAKHSMLDLFSAKRDNLSWNVEMHLERWNSVKWYMAVRARMIRFDSEGNTRDEERPTFRSSAQIILTSDTVQLQMDQAFFKVNSSLETLCSSASGWMLEEIMYVEQFIFKYVPLGGNCGDFRIPVDLSLRRALISVIGRPADSKDCFVWAVTAALHHDPERHRTEVHWKEFCEDRKRYKLPEQTKTDETLTIVQIPDFERMNGVSVNVFAYEQHVFPLHVSTYNGSNGHASLLLLQVEDLQEEAGYRKHYCAITDLGRLVHKERRYEKKTYVCPRCLTTKYADNDLKKHMEFCNSLDPLHVKMPESRFLKFRNYSRQLETPFVIVARFECFRRPILDHREPTEGFLVRERMHKPCAFSYYSVSVDDSHPSEPVFFYDECPEKVMTEFLQCMQREQEAAMQIMKVIKPVVFCDEGARNIQASNDNCHICDNPFLQDQTVAIDKDHICGKIRGRACLGCNLNFRVPKQIVVVLNDLSAYDGRIVMCAAAIHGVQNISVIPKTIDTYAGIVIDRCRFVDFKSFLKEPLDSLIEDLRAEKGRGCFLHIARHWPKELTSLEMRRIPLCRDHLLRPEELAHTLLPPIESFEDSVDDRRLSDVEYATVVQTWNRLPEKTVHQLLKVALITDCLFTADVVQTVRETLRKSTKLDPLRYLTLASFAWDSALRYSETTMELQTSIDAHLMIENAIRGGIAVVGNPRYARANNPEMPSEQYDQCKGTSYIDFLDFNELYNSVMATARLPSTGFRFLTDFELETFDFESVPEDSDHGYILEVDLAYPPELHDDHDDFPLAPEKTKILKEDMSPYTVNTATSARIDLDHLDREERLCLTLRDKKSYTTHYLNLQFYTKHGLKVTKIQRVLRFSQVSFLQEFMQFCGARRIEARYPLYKNLDKVSLEEH